MGYMGFGMQKWLYTQKPKKFLSYKKVMDGHEILGLRDEKSTKKHTEATQIGPDSFATISPYYKLNVIPLFLAGLIIVAALVAFFLLF